MCTRRSTALSSASPSRESDSMTAVRRGGPGGGPSIAEPLQRDATTDASFRRLLGYLEPYRPSLVGSGVLVVAASLLNLLGPWLQGCGHRRLHRRSATSAAFATSSSCCR